MGLVDASRMSSFVMDSQIASRPRMRLVVKNLGRAQNGGIVVTIRAESTTFVSAFEGNMIYSLEAINFTRGRSSREICLVEDEQIATIRSRKDNNCLFIPFFFETYNQVEKFRPTIDPQSRVQCVFKFCWTELKAETVHAIRRSNYLRWWYDSNKSYPVSDLLLTNQNFILS